MLRVGEVVGLLVFEKMVGDAEGGGVALVGSKEVMVGGRGGRVEVMGDAEGVRVGSFVRGEMVGEPSGSAGQKAGHAPPRSGP